jgi:hypothetical protein
MKRGAVLALALVALPASSWADDEDDDDLSTDALGDQKGSDRVSAKEAELDRSRANVFEKERFFIDKIDSESTEDSTLFQGNLTSSTLLYSESGGTLKGSAGQAGAGSNSPFSRMFSDLRLQLDARHIRGGRWQARFDVRGRVTNDPADRSATSVSDNTRVQAGFTGDNEAEIKELWITRPGDRIDVFLGRQFVPDLGAVKIDGLRLDYAKSDRVTLLGFVGAYPVRGSRSIDTDYPVLRRNDGSDLGRTPPIAAGAGAAYRTALSYGSFGAGTVAPLKAERPRIFLTASGYTRNSSTLDLYHLALVDVVSESGFAVNNLSGGVNFRPSPALHLTASVNHVDTETLNVQAKAFLETPDAIGVRNDTAVRRVSSTQIRGGVSVALGQLQQLEVSVGLAGRYRPEVDVGGAKFQEATSIDVTGQIVHRNLLSSRIGADFIRSFSLGDVAARSLFLTYRGFLSREFRQGRGSWEAEVAYSSTKDDNVMGLLLGTSATKTVSFAGNVYYRLRTSLFVMGSAAVGRLQLDTLEGTTVLEDPAVLSLTGYFRLGYRF